jgi:hypothetical protein
MSAPHTGMDNQHERVGYWLDRFCEGVDLNSYLVRELRAFSRLDALYGWGDVAEEYTAKLTLASAFEPCSGTSGRFFL